LKELTEEEFIDRLIIAGWSKEEAIEEWERIQSGEYDDD
jgi:hypothetical protein